MALFWSLSNPENSYYSYIVIYFVYFMLGRPSLIPVIVMAGTKSPRQLKFSVDTVVSMRGGAGTYAWLNLIFLLIFFFFGYTSFQVKRGSN